MRRITELSLALLIIIILIAVSSAQMTSVININSRGVVNLLDWLHVDGQWIVDESGNRVALRGLGGDYLHYGSGLEQSTIDMMKAKGLTSFRLAFNFAPLTPSFFVHSTLDFAKMDAQIRRLEANGIYTILDAHYLGADWTNPAYLNTFIAEWVKVAEHYKDWPAVAAYELVGEPIGNPATIRNAYLQVIDAVRAVDPNHIILVFDWIKTERELLEATQQTYNGICWIPNTCNRPNIIYSVHYAFWYHEARYSETPIEIGNTDFSLAKCAASNEVYLIQKYREFVNAPVTHGEFMAHDRNISYADMLSVKETIRMSEEAGIPWNLWSTDINPPYNWNWLIPSAFTNRYFPTNPIVSYAPFNLFNYIVKQGGPSYQAYGRHYEASPAKFQVTNNGDYIILNGGSEGIKVKIRVCQGYAYEPANIRTTYVTTIGAGQNVTIMCEEGTASYPGDWNILVYSYE